MLAVNTPPVGKALDPRPSLGSRIDFLRYQIPPSTVLVELMHVATSTVRVIVGDETAELAAGDSCS